MRQCVIFQKPIVSRICKKIAQNSAGTLKLFQADLLAEGSFDQAMVGCELVMHTASPFIISGFNDAYEALIRPALDGTRNVFASVERTPSVKRVVLTSSVAAVYGDNKEALNVPNAVFNETYWNTSSILTHMPYHYSKTVAEREGWRLQAEQSVPHRWDLVCINPSFIVGPADTG